MVLSYVGDRLKRMQIEGWDKLWGPGIGPGTIGYSAISLDLDDLYAVGEPMEFRARLVNVSEPTGSLQARIESIGDSSNRTVKREFREAV